MVAARFQKVVSYPVLAAITGLPAAGLAKYLGPIQSYCELKKLPPLTSLVVSSLTGEPSHGFNVRKGYHSDQNRTFVHDWLADAAPTPEQFEAAEKEAKKKTST